jgi:hypothetical protein
VVNSCAFCQIANGGVPAGIVFEDDLTLAFLDHRPVFPGHCLVIPRQHFDSLVDLPSPLLAQLSANARLLAIAVEKGLGAQGAFPRHQQSSKPKRPASARPCGSKEQGRRTKGIFLAAS